MAKQVDLTTGQEVPLDPKVVKIIKDEPVSMDDFVKGLDEDEETTCNLHNEDCEACGS
tara:strand:- start:324 stop:497 length:174 start_codon:yes stop_codon:yes gene_type:complete